MSPLIRTFSIHYREKYGQPVGKIPVDNGYPCPNSPGCIFCLPESYTPGYLRKTESISNQIEQGKVKLLKNRFRLYFAYYQQGSCTVAPTSELMQQAEILLDDSNCVGIIYSTRPDCISHDFLAPLSTLFAARGKECHFELGLQSIHEKSLRFLNRNHSTDHFHDSFLKIKEYGNFHCGAHLILGIPGESQQEMVQSINYLTDLGVDSLKLHHLQILKHTTLFEMHKKENFTLFEKQEYIEFLATTLPLIPSHIILHRLWTHSHPALLIAPKWNVLPGILSKQLHDKMRENGVQQGSAFSTPKTRIPT